MTDQPFLIKLEEVKEHENGDATYVFDMTDAAEKSVMQEGLKLLLFCGVAKVDLQDVYDWILAQEDIRPMTDEERQRAKEREEANKCSP